jgi:hypothetical protein
MEVDKKREKYDRVYRSLLADAKGDVAMAEKIFMEIFAQPEPAEAMVEFNGILSAFALKGLDAYTGGRQQTIELIESAIARGVDPDFD